MKKIQIHKDSIEILKSLPWTKEPSELRFHHANYFCLIKRNPTSLVLSGYVEIGASHPWFNRARDRKIELHPGTRHSGMLAGEDGFWIGFTADAREDMIPDSYVKSSAYWTYVESIPTYRNFEFVTNQTKFLADQMRKLEDEYKKIKWNQDNK